MQHSKTTVSGGIARTGASLQVEQADSTQAQLEHMSNRMRQVEGEFARFFAQSIDLLCIAGSDGYFKRLNPAWTSCLGWTLEELQATPFLNFVHPDDREATLAQIDRRNQGEKTILFENRYRHQDGSYLWLRWNAQPVPEHQQVYGSARDVTQQKRLEREIIEIADGEKERLGRDLHDGLCQTLAGIAAMSFALSRKLAADAEPGAATAVEIAQLLNNAIGETRDLARGLSPVALDKTGLEAALADLALMTEGQYSISCTFLCRDGLHRLRPEVETHLYRITQEALRNAITHGRAKGIEISLSQQDGQGVLSIWDDGVGLSQEAIERDGIGLHTMVYRSRLIGASLAVTPHAQRGTTVTCIFPLPDAQTTQG